MPLFFGKEEIMKTDVIYRSVVKGTKEEVLVYKNIFDKYRDFKSSREFNEEDLKDFISFTKMLGYPTNIAKQAVIQFYYSFQNRELPHHSTYVGDVAIIKKSQENHDAEYTFEIIKQNRIFSKWQDEYTDIEDYEKYRDDEIEFGKMVIVNIELINERLNNELSGIRTSRQKLLKFYHEKFSENK